MYYMLSEQITNFFIRHLRNFWATHPKYQDMVGHIQGKYSWNSTPNKGIVVKTGGNSHQRYSADNYKGVMCSYCTLFKPKGTRGVSIEWLKEDKIAISRNNGFFPSPPGYYFVRIVNIEPQSAILTFEVTKYLDVTDEIVQIISPITGMLQHPPIDGSLRIKVMTQDYELFEDINYFVNYTTGEITFIQPIPNPPTYITANYRYNGGVVSDYQVKENNYHKEAIPGVLMAFGRRSFVNDVMTIVITELREPAYLIHGGKWTGSLDLDCFSKDLYEQREITDLTLHFIESMLRPGATKYGIEITEVSSSGEVEEPYDDNADDYKYSNPISVSVETEWERHTPLIATVSSIEPLTLFQQQQYAGLTDEQIALVSNNIRYTNEIGLVGIRDPFFNGRRTFEGIK